MKTELQDHADKLFPPAFIYVGGLAIGLLVHLRYPVQLLPAPFKVGIALLLLVVSGPIFVSTRRAYYRAKTTFYFSEPSTALITSGPYRYSRNPGYVSLAMLFGAIGFLLNSLWVLLMVVPAMIVVHFGIIKREERYLEAKFGDEYREYKTTVRRWV